MFIPSTTRLLASQIMPILVHEYLHAIQYAAGIISQEMISHPTIYAGWRHESEAYGLQFSVSKGWLRDWRRVFLENRKSPSRKLTKLLRGSDCAMLFIRTLHASPIKQQVKGRQWVKAVKSVASATVKVVTMVRDREYHY